MALVVTIVVLIILATVSISAVVGDNGIIAKAKLAKNIQANSIQAEQDAMDELFQKYANAMAGEGSVGDTTNEENGGSTVITTYSIIYNLDGGILGSGAVTSYNIETETFSLPIPTRENYNFEGWYTSSDFSGSAVTQIVKGSTGDKYYYAKWEVANSIPYFTYTLASDGTVVDYLTPNYEDYFRITYVSGQQKDVLKTSSSNLYKRL